MKNTLTLFVLCFIHFTIVADTDSDQLDVESRTCEFDGKNLTLSGSVTLDHELGTLTAEEAIIYADPSVKKLSVGMLEIKKNVTLKSKDGGELTCDIAKINYKTMHGRFLSDDPAGFVIYRDGGNDKDKPSLIVQSRSMDAIVDRSKEGAASHGSKISEITALEDVNVAFNSRQGDSNPTVVFTGGKLHWDLKRDLITLSHNVNADLSGGATLKTEKEIEIYYHLVEGKRQLRAIVTHGYTILTSPDENHPEQHRTLQSFGGVTVDHEKLETTFNSPRDDHGKVVEDLQVVFRDSVGELHADKLRIFYQSIDDKLIPINMRAEGNVYLLDRKGAPVDMEASMLHYAIADSVDYNFEKKEAYFSSANKKRVLFFDRVNNLQISAPALKLKRDGAAKKPSIQGVGDVRFSFMENEAERLKQRFENLPNRY